MIPYLSIRILVLSEFILGLNLNIERVIYFIFLITRYSMIMSFDTFEIYYVFDTFEKYYVFENIMENGAFALLEQMLHFP